MLELITGYNPALWQLCPLMGPAEIRSQETQELAQDMIKLMNAKRGVGLAANQVGLLKSIIVVKNPLTWVDTVMINPKIIAFKNGIAAESEGCLSFPGKTTLVRRFKSVKVAYDDLTGAKATMALKGLHARIAQHEIAHLDGMPIFGKHFYQAA